MPLRPTLLPDSRPHRQHLLTKAMHQPQMCLRVALTPVAHPAGTVPVLPPLPYPTPRLPRIQRRRHALSHIVSGESQLQIALYAARKSTAQKMQYGAAPSADKMYIANAFEIGGRIASTRLARGV